MLKTVCQECSKPIHSNLLAEISSINCPSCKKKVNVGELYVVSKGYSVLRKDLLMRIGRYERMLREAEHELMALKEQKGVNEQKIGMVEQYVTTYRELLAGARKHFRMRAENIPVELNFSKKNGLGKFINISLGGACIEPKDIAVLPSIKEEIILDFMLNNEKKKLSIRGEVLWVKKGSMGRSFNSGIGIKFNALEKDSRMLLWKEISGRESLYA